MLLLRNATAARWVTFGVTAATFALAVTIAVLFWLDAKPNAAYAYAADGGPNGGVVQMVQDVPWVAAFDVHYRVGVDGLSVPMLLLTTFVTPLAVLAGFNNPRMGRGYLALVLLLESLLVGVFVSLDLFLFYAFFELSLLPMYFLIGIWGGPRREYAALKFFLYTLVGSVALLAARDRPVPLQPPGRARRHVRPDPAWPTRPRATGAGVGPWAATPARPPRRCSPC